MDCSLTISKTERIVYAVFSGQFTLDLLPPLASEVLELGAKNGTNRYLADVRAATSDISTTQIYRLPRLFETLGLKHNARVALVIPGDSEQQEDFEFYRTVSLNQGFNVNLFDDPDTARQWLVRQGAPLDTVGR